jgi:hypothetical protein
MAGSDTRRKIEFPWQQSAQGEPETMQPDTAPWGRATGEQQEVATPDPNSIMAVVMPVAARRKKRSRDWEKRNPQVCYRGVSAHLHQELKNIAIDIGIKLDDVVRAFLEYGLNLVYEDRLILTPQLGHGKLTLYPENSNWTQHKAWMVNGNGQPPEPVKRGRKKKQETMGRRWKNKVVYRVPDEVHEAVKSAADAISVPVGDIVTVFFQQSLHDYRNGFLQLNPQPAVIRKTLFPEG